MFGGRGNVVSEAWKRETQKSLRRRPSERREGVGGSGKKKKGKIVKIGTKRKKMTASPVRPGVEKEVHRSSLLGNGAKGGEVLERGKKRGRGGAIASPRPKLMNILYQTPEKKNETAGIQEGPPGCREEDEVRGGGKGGKVHRSQDHPMPREPIGSDQNKRGGRGKSDTHRPERRGV